MITKEQKEYYLKNIGLKCPFCQSNDLESSPIDCDNHPYARVICLDCKKEWKDIYKLVDIEEV